MNAPGAGQSSLISRFAASTAALAAAAVLLAIVFFAVLHSDFFRGAIDSTLRGYSVSIAGHISPEADPEYCRTVAERHRVGLVVETDERRFAFAPGGLEVDPDAFLEPSLRYRRIDVDTLDGQKIIVLWDMVIFARAHVPLLIGLIALLLIVIGATYAFQLGQLRPLQWLRSGVEAVSVGNFDVRVPVVRQDEIGRVARAFNEMTGRVEQMMSDRERLLADVGHELRSPLARIKVALELLPDSPERRAITKDVGEMTSLTALLLERERLRHWVQRSSDHPIDLVPVARTVVDSFAERSPGIVLHTPESLLLGSDTLCMETLIRNLVDNALKFSLPESAPVEVRLGLSREAGSEQVELLVVDDGIGIPAADRERIFEPFVKLDPARGHRGGHGLGANLCLRIVEGHGGTIEVHGSGGRGTTVRVLLPRNAPIGAEEAPAEAAS